MNNENTEPKKAGRRKHVNREKFPITVPTKLRNDIEKHCDEFGENLSGFMCRCARAKLMKIDRLKKYGKE